MGRERERDLARGAREENALAGEAVDRRGPGERVAVDAQSVGAHRVDRDQENARARCAARARNDEVKSGEKAADKERAEEGQPALGGISWV
jgi:hypothetical protein